MTVEELANITMSAISFTNMWLMIVSVIGIIMVAYLTIKVKKQEAEIEQLRQKKSTRRPTRRVEYK